MSTTTTDTKAPATTDTKAGNGKPQAPVYTAEHPEFPKMLYNSKNRTVVPAKDKDEEGKLQGKGYTEDPYPPIPPDQMTSQDMQQLESLLHKLLAELSKQNAAQPAQSGTADAADSQPPVPGAEPYPGATGAKDQGSSATPSTSGASHKPPAK